MTDPGKISEPARADNIYVNGDYLDTHPLWHVEESSFKVTYILRMIDKHGLQPKTIGEVGCGAGEVLRLLQERMDPTCRFWGYDISPQALALCQSRANERLQFRLADLSQEAHAAFDLLLVLDVMEHVEDYFGFLKGLRPRAALKIFHIPLDVSVQAVLRRNGLLKRRQDHGHIHYFTRETALATLNDAGYDVLDSVFTPRCIELGTALAQRIARLPRRLCFAIHQDWTVRILGGYSLLVLAR